MGGFKKPYTKKPVECLLRLFPIEAYDKTSYAWMDIC